MATYNLRQDERGWTHFDWELKGITAEMIDWHWSNMEKDFFMWHPSDHKRFFWAEQPTAQKFIGSIHRTSQSRGTDRSAPENERGLKYWDIKDVPQAVVDQVIYDHACFVGLVLYNAAGPGGAPITDGLSHLWRVHQWQDTAEGIVGITSAMDTMVEDVEAEKAKGIYWAKHAMAEIENFAAFFPELFIMWSKVPNDDRNPLHSLKLKKAEEGLRYENL
jgi:hypothetical protein